MYLYYYLYIYMFILGGIFFSYWYKHVLLSLMMLEFMMLSLLLLISDMMIKFCNLSIIMYFLVFVVCESVYGLAMLALMIRSSGSASVNGLNLVLW